MKASKTNSEYIIPQNSEHHVMFTDDHIDKIFMNEVFVFGSNLQGHHTFGAAHAAMKRFGAIWGQGVGLQGNSYAIPTMQGGVDTIKPYVDEFIEFAKEHQELHFLVTRIGCGIAGFKDEEIAPLFKKAQWQSNVSLPWNFVNIHDAFPQIPMPTYQKLNKYGQTRTLLDIIKTLNDLKKYSDVRSLEVDLNNSLAKYEIRGTLDWDVCYEMLQALKELPLITDGFVDVEKLAKHFDDIKEHDYPTAVSAIYSRRVKTKILRIAKLLNEIKHYRDLNLFIQDLTSICLSKSVMGGTEILVDFFNQLFSFFRERLPELWDKLTTDGKLDNNKLEEVMFTVHEKRLEKLGLTKVLDNYYKPDGHEPPCYYIPIGDYLGPYYTRDRYNRGCVSSDDLYMKSCGLGHGIYSFPYSFEVELLIPILEQEVKNGNYIQMGRYYIPTTDLETKPILNDWGGAIELHGIHNKIRFIELIKKNQDQDVYFS